MLLWGAAMHAREALRLAIAGGARNLGRDDIGKIAPGFAADFVGWRTDTIGFSGAGKDPVAGLLYCTPSIGFVDLSVINGEIIVRDGELQTLDLKVRVRVSSGFARNMHADLTLFVLPCCCHLKSGFKACGPLPCKSQFELNCNLQQQVDIWWHIQQ